MRSSTWQSVCFNSGCLASAPSPVTKLYLVWVHACKQNIIILYCLGHPVAFSTASIQKKDHTIHMIHLESMNCSIYKLACGSWNWADKAIADMILWSPFDNPQQGWFFKGCEYPFYKLCCSLNQKNSVSKPKWAVCAGVYRPIVPTVVNKAVNGHKQVPVSCDWAGFL